MKFIIIYVYNNAQWKKKSSHGFEESKDGYIEGFRGRKNERGSDVIIISKLKEIIIKNTE